MPVTENHCCASKVSSHVNKAIVSVTEVCWGSHLDSCRIRRNISASCFSQRSLKN